MPSVALWEEAEFRPYKSLRMSRGRKMSLGSVCRLLLASELQERPQGHLKKRDQDPGKSRGHVGPSPTWAQVSGTYRWVKDLSPLKVNLESAQMSLFSMKLEKIRICLSCHSGSKTPGTDFLTSEARVQLRSLRQASIVCSNITAVVTGC